MNRFSHVIKNISYTLSSNFLSLCVSVIVSLLLPKVLGVSEYGYYQLYIFYVSYVGLLHFGWCDGIYLRYGGNNYKDIDKEKMSGQFYSLLFFQTIVTFIFLVAVYFMTDNDVEKKFVLYFSTLNIIILNLRTFYMLLLQTTNRMKDYSIIVLVDRFIFVFSILVLIVFRVSNVRIYILVDLLSKLVSLIIALYKCSDITVSRKIDFNLIETKANIFSGINLMLANIASMLIIGIVRFGIQDNWDVETFGKISLTLSISNMLMVFVGAVSLAIFPLIKKTDESNYSKIYPAIRTMIVPVILILLIFYFPAELLLSKWLPQYKESLKYMVIVFPMVVFESKVSLLTNTFLKAMRKEKDIFKINLISALLSLILTFIFVYLMNSLFWSMLSIVILLAIRSTLSEIVLKKSLNIDIFKEIILEISMVSIFIYFGWNYSKIVGLVVYLIALCIYFILKRKSIKKTINLLKNDTVEV